MELQHFIGTAIPYFLEYISRYCLTLTHFYRQGSYEYISFG